VSLIEILARLEFVLETLGDGDQWMAVDVLLDLRDELLGGATVVERERRGA
jgi:hypothetical protein